MLNFEISQIVRGAKAGVFVILDFYEVDGEIYAELKELNPNDISQLSPTETILPLRTLKSA